MSKSVKLTVGKYARLNKRQRNKKIRMYGKLEVRKNERKTHN